MPSDTEIAFIEYFGAHIGVVDVDLPASPGQKLFLMLVQVGLICQFQENVHERLRSGIFWMELKNLKMFNSERAGLGLARS